MGLRGRSIFPQHFFLYNRVLTHNLLERQNVSKRANRFGGAFCSSYQMLCAKTKLSWTFIVGQQGVAHEETLSRIHFRSIYNPLVNFSLRLYITNVIAQAFEVNFKQNPCFVYSK